MSSASPSPSASPSGKVITNPILRGFRPDPSIVRVNEDYYIATSTFEWFPGIEIHHSRDLVHWRLLTHALTSTSQLDLLGNSDSGGVWAPCLSYDDGTFYLLFSNDKSYHDSFAFQDAFHFLTTASDIMGPWSDPVMLNKTGFDPSLVHAPDGRKYVAQVQWDYRPADVRQRFAGIVLQQLDPELKRLVGPVMKIFEGTKLGITEGPHILFHSEYFYLVVAEGGTGWNHAVTVARARHLTGPYE
eukprot:RCo009037